MRMLYIVEVPAGIPQPRVDLAQSPSPEVESAPGPTASAAHPIGPTTEASPPTRTIRDRTAPRSLDPRLWASPAPATRTEPDALERAISPVRMGVAELNDSIAAAEEAERRASDWTSHDGDGGRWGISPDRLHLGATTLRLRYCTVEPCPGWLLPTPPDRRDEYAKRVRGFDEIRMQASRAALDAALTERVRAMRALDRARRDSAKGGGTDVTDPDERAPQPADRRHSSAAICCRADRRSRSAGPCRRTSAAAVTSARHSQDPES